jgi:hypothetical protein
MPLVPLSLSLSLSLNPQFLLPAQSLAVLPAILDAVPYSAAHPHTRLGHAPHPDQSLPSAVEFRYPNPPAIQ